MKTYLDKLKDEGKAPEWLTEEAYTTLSKNKERNEGYLLANEEPIDLYKRLAATAQKYLKEIPDLEKKIFEYLWKGYLCPATPVATNFGTNRGLPISCFGSWTSDDLGDIFNSYHETAMLTKHGGGIGKGWGDVRGRGEAIGKTGYSQGIVPWLKVEEQTLQSVAQGGVRRGAGAQYLPVWHKDIEEFIDIRRPTGDPSRKCLSTNFHHAVVIPDEFMRGLKTKPQHLQLWQNILKARTETGEPYLMFIDNANRGAPDCYKQNKLKIKMSQLCNEIYLYNDHNHTFVCCLSSLNLRRWDEMPSDVIEYSTYFLEAVMQEFINKSEDIVGFEKARRFAEKSRALGLGVLGWHSYLQKNMIPFESFSAMQENNEIFKTLDAKSWKATQRLASLYGEPEWCKGFGIRNTHRLAVAPTASNSLISGGLSQGIEPILANYYAQKTARGTFIRKNPELEKLLINKGKNDFKIWSDINKNMGSVQHLDFLTKEEKEVFKTAREIDQNVIVDQAAQRQKYIDQGQSVNLFFSVPDLSSTEKKQIFGKYIHRVHYNAWEKGLKGLYYCRMQSSIRGDDVFKMMESSCKSCEG